jgi:hypothetical protein
MSRQNIKVITMAIFLFLLVGSVFSQDVAQYDESISKMVGKLRQYPLKTKYMTELGENYRAAQKVDQDLILQLKQSGQPDIWYKVYLANKRIADRQDLVKTLPQKTLEQSGITFIDNAKDLEESRVRAGRYCYAIAQKMLADSTPESARLAYVELLKIARMKFNQAPDLDKMIRRSILLGATSIEFALYNKSGKNLTGDIVGRMDKIVWDYKKVKYGQQKGDKPAIPFKFTMRVVITDVSVGQDQMKDLAYEEQRDIYKDDVVVDTIDCYVKEYRQLKKASMGGRIEFYDNQIGQVVNTVPLAVEVIFSNAYATLQGNPDAAGDETRRLLVSKQAAYPSAEQMVLDATDEFVRKATQVVLAQ